MDQVARVTEETFNWIRQVSSNLFHPLTIRLVDYSCDVDTPSLQVDGEQYEISDKSTLGQHFHSKEVHCSYLTPMSFKKCLPGRSFAALGRWFIVRIGQNAFDGISAKIVTKIPVCTAQSCIAPARVCSGLLNIGPSHFDVAWPDDPEHPTAVSSRNPWLNGYIETATLGHWAPEQLR